MPRFYRAPDEVVVLVRELIEQHHEPLCDAKIGLLMRDEAPQQGNGFKLGQARKVTPEQRAFADYDFIIWFAWDWWERLRTNQKRALADHELCHCRMFGGKTTIRRHDFEEFHEIIERYGFWRPLSGPLTQRSVHLRLGFQFAAGTVEPVNVSQNGDIMEQIDDIFDDDGEEEEEGAANG